MPIRLPRGSGCEPSRAAASTSSPRLVVVITPAWANSASWVISGVAVAAVCEAAARWPAADRPPSTVSTGNLRPTRRAVLANRRGLPNDSTYSTASLVTSSCSHHISRSLLDTSYLSPTEANEDTPRPSRARCSSRAMPMPPDWTTRPVTPGEGGGTGEGGVQADGRYRDAEAVRSDQAHAVLPAGGQQLRGRGDASGDDHERLSASPAALLRHAHHAGRRDRDHHDIGRLRQLGDGGQGRPAGHR